MIFLVTYNAGYEEYINEIEANNWHEIIEMFDNSDCWIEKIELIS